MAGPDLLPLYELIVTGAWGDYVDEVAISRVGPLLRAEPRTPAHIMRRWAVDDYPVAPPRRGHLPGQRHHGHLP